MDGSLNGSVDGSLMERDAHGRYTKGHVSAYHAKKRERQQMMRDLVAELGAGNLTRTDKIELRHAVELVTRRPRNHNDAVRTLACGSRVIDRIRQRITSRKPEQPVPPLSAYRGDE